MLVSASYEELDLPVHDPDTFVATGFDLRNNGVQGISEDYTLSKFVRAVEITLEDLAHAPGSTAELLKNTDRELQEVAELCGALVVGHEWGLYPVDGKGLAYRRYIPASRGLGKIIVLPKNHILVAEVDAIKPTHPAGEGGVETDEAVEAIRTGVREYYEAGKGTYQLFDMRFDPVRSGRTGPKLGQFERGTPVGTPTEGVGTYVIDIDPRFSLTR